MSKSDLDNWAYLQGRYPDLVAYYRLLLARPESHQPLTAASQHLAYVAKLLTDNLPAPRILLSKEEFEGLQFPHDQIHRDEVKL